jgi:hypothetical protein
MAANSKRIFIVTLLGIKKRRQALLSGGPNTRASAFRWRNALRFHGFVTGAKWAIEMPPAAAFA